MSELQVDFGAHGEAPFPSLRLVTIQRGDGVLTSPNPPLSQTWDDLTKLRWQAAVCRVRDGVDVRVNPADYRVGRREQRGYYSVHVGGSVMGPYRFDSAWTLINGISAGAAAASTADRGGQ